MSVMLVFNGKKWREAGGDIGDNRQFWEPAEIVRTYTSFGDGEILAEVKWPDGSMSNGHIVSCMKDMPFHPPKE